MKKFLSKHTLLIINLLVSVFLTVLPYMLFQGKYYISGDDTRLYYIYPYEYLVEFTFSSWHHFSSVGANGPTQFMMPFLLLWSFLDIIIGSKVVLAYLGFSSPLILGFFFFQIFIGKLLPAGKNGLIGSLGASFYIFSPIMVYNQYFIFLSTIWLIPLVPILGYFYLNYIESGKFENICFAVFFSILFSIGLFSIPWVVGFLLPLLIGVLITNFFVKKFINSRNIKRTIVFVTSIFISQLFWLFPFIMTYFGGSDVNFGSKVFTKAVSDTFSPTVLATATGNIIYPLLNLFHRQIAFDSTWQLKEVFLTFYDKTLLINIIFPVLLFVGLLNFKKLMKEQSKGYYFVFFIAFLIALFLFTVNIGPLKELFLLLGNIPGFVMFRNFYDKLGMSFTIFYAILISFSLFILKLKSIKAFYILSLVFLVVLFANFTQVGKIVNAPLWLTENTGRNIKIPDEYIDFMNKVREKVPTTNNIFTVPFGTALYSIIKDADSDNVYTGTSPVKLFSGVNDYSGFLSFYFSEANSIIEELIVNKKYDKLSDILHTYNVNYAFHNANIPEDVLSTWVFDKRMNKSLDKNFIENFFEKEPIIISKSGNYKLYKLKKSNLLINSRNLSYQKINETKFRIYLSGLTHPEELLFADSYHHGWKLFLKNAPSKIWCKSKAKLNDDTECEEDKTFLEGDELLYSFTKPVFNNSHMPYTDYYVNKWTIDPQYIKKNFNETQYIVNPDGSIDVELIMYFVPQNYFYFGSIVSILFSMFCFYYLLNSKLKKSNK